MSSDPWYAEMGRRNREQERQRAEAEREARFEWRADLRMTVSCSCGQELHVSADFDERLIPATVVRCACSRSYQLQGELDVVEVIAASAGVDNKNELARASALADAIDRHGPEFA